jgi:sterol desaturase/sphingolipid hydroxylase (fatty acid hydroxylase superfamily)
MEGGGVVTDSTRDWQRRRRRIGSAVGVALAALVITGLIRETQHIAAVMNAGTVHSIGSSLWAGWCAALLNAWYWGLVLCLLLAERLWPAQPGRGMLTTGGAQDLVWILLFPVTGLTVVALWSVILNVMYTNLLGDHTLDLPSYIGVFPTAVFAFVVSDFLFWFSHWLRHKVPTFWYFHAVHHAARDLNTLTDNRVHFEEAMVTATLVVVPSRFLGLAAPAAFALTVATTYFTAFTHTAVRTNMGPLRYLLVTPQSHRVHHSQAKEHIDVNFGTVFSVWDLLFRTQYRGWDEYPDTGIADQAFPLERSVNPASLVTSYVDGRLPVPPDVPGRRQIPAPRRRAAGGRVTPSKHHTQSPQAPSEQEFSFVLQVVLLVAASGPAVSRRPAGQREHRSAPGCRRGRQLPLWLVATHEVCRIFLSARFQAQ